jgi:hypothetical protein
MWRQHPEYLSFDNTYKTNRFNMPLLQIGGLTGLHTNFCVGFSLTSGEAEEDFLWSLEQLKTLAQGDDFGGPINFPLAIMSDYDNAFKNAARKVFQKAKQQLCVWHIMKNVVHNIKQKWRGPLGDFAGGVSENARIAGPASDANSDQYNDRGDEVYASDEALQAVLQPESSQQIVDPSVLKPKERRRLATDYENTPAGLLEAWRAVVYAPTKEEFDECWKTLCRVFITQQGQSLFFLLNNN